jgi:hypothetical protein
MLAIMDSLIMCIISKREKPVALNVLPFLSHINSYDRQVNDFSTCLK